MEQAHEWNAQLRAPLARIPPCRAAIATDGYFLVAIDRLKRSSPYA